MNTSAKYNSERLMTVLLAPVVSEKGTYIADKHQQVIFRVMPNATKPEVKAAVELMFGKKDKPIEVMSVQIVVDNLDQSAATRRRRFDFYECHAYASAAKLIS